MKELAQEAADRSGIYWTNGGHVLIGMPEGAQRERLVHTVGKCSGNNGIAIVSAFGDLEARAARELPSVIVLSEDVLRSGTHLNEAVRRLTPLAPVVVLASAERQSEIIGLVISGEVDFVTRSGEFDAVVAAAFVERRLSWLQDCSREFHSAWTADIPADFAELLRHEINNPLTGILGNAELLLSQLRDKLPPLSVQRLETVVDLAVRLREKVRCLVSKPGNGKSKIDSH
jgi:signal transduction histidine kinase